MSGCGCVPMECNLQKEACKSEPQTSALEYLLFASSIFISDGWMAQKNEIPEIYIIYYWVVLLWRSSVNNLEKNMMLSDVLFISQLSSGCHLDTSSGTHLSRTNSKEAFKKSKNKKIPAYTHKEFQRPSNASVCSSLTAHMPNPQISLWIHLVLESFQLCYFVSIILSAFSSTVFYFLNACLKFYHSICLGSS